MTIIYYLFSWIFYCRFKTRPTTITFKFIFTFKKLFSTSWTII